MSSKEGFYGTKADEGSFRRTWNKEEFRKRAEERDKRERELEEETENKRKALKPGEPARDLLQAREDKVNFDSGVGKIKVVQAVAGVASKQPGFYCEVCDCVVKDSANYLDHINGRKHQSNLGMSMKVERSSLDQIKAKLASLKKKDEKPKEYNFEERVEAARKQEEESKQRKREKKKEKKREIETQQAAELGEMDPEMAAMMGFGGFGTSKKN
ncbi:U4/U6.U5 snRNP associated protein [Basidiobolus ranarum]|uniref:U4/U6.U5 snRNP associated protein n=1 Tax=Basidiobolus ranarum TaxID=34480 RepID=A0ABR2WX85_9FUNG